METSTVDIRMSSGEKELLDQINQGFLALDENLIILYANPVFLSMIESDLDSLRGTDFPNLLSVSETEFNISDPVPGGVFQLSLSSFSGRLLKLEFSFSPLIDSNEELSGYAVLVRNTFNESDRTLKMQRSIDRYREIASAGADWLWETDSTGTYTFVSEEVTDSLGYTPEELFGRTPFEFMAEDEAERVASIFNRVASTGVPFRNLVSTVLSRSGEKLILSTSGIPIRDGSGELTGYRGSDRNITHEVETLNRLKSSLETVLKILDNLPAGVVVTDGEQTVLQANPAACRIAGVKAEQVIGRKSCAVFCSGCTKECIASPGRGESVSCRFNLQRHDKTFIPVMKNVIHLSGSTGENFIQVITDLSSERVNMEELSSRNIILERELEELREFIGDQKRSIALQESLHEDFYQRIIDALCGIAGSTDILFASTEPKTEITELLHYHTGVLSDTLNSQRDNHDFITDKFTSEREDFLLSSLLSNTVAPFSRSFSEKGITCRIESGDIPGAIWNGPARGIRTVLFHMLKELQVSSEILIGMCEVETDTGTDSIRVYLHAGRSFPVPVNDGEEEDLNPEGMNEVTERCRDFASQIGSELFFEKLPSGGFRTWMDIPAVRICERQAAPEIPAGTVAVILTDDPGTAGVYSAMVRTAGMQVEHAWNSRELEKSTCAQLEDASLKRCTLVDADSSPGRVVLQYRQPGHVGFPRNIVNGIVLCSRVRPGDLRNCSRLGMRAILLKPVGLGRLTDCIARVVSAGSEEDRLFTDRFL